MKLFLAVSASLISVVAGALQCANDDAAASVITGAEAWLTATNAVRAGACNDLGCSVAPPAMAWSEDLGKAAGEYAAILAANGCADSDEPNVEYSQTVFTYTGTFTSVDDLVATAVGTWNSPVLANTVGSQLDYTRMVWGASTIVGCAEATMDGTCYSVVCNYYPHGNCASVNDGLLEGTLEEGLSTVLSTDTIALCDPECPAYTGTLYGDPHIMKWNGEKYDFHGECDLVFINAPDFMNGLGLDIHVRTTIEDFYSYISDVAIKAGDHIINIDMNNLWIDETRQTKFPAEQEYVRASKKHNAMKNITEYWITIDETYNMKVQVGPTGYMTVSVVTAGQAFKDMHHFKSSQGLMGQYPSGETFGRDGVTEITSPIEFGMEWQVQPYDEMLFLEAREPQLPHAKCIMPTMTHAQTVSRRLRANPELREMAEKACQSADSEMFVDCVEDVMATGDIDIAATY